MYTFIVNPNARSGLGQKLWLLVEADLKERGAKYQVFFTKYQRHAAKLVRGLTSDLKPHTIVVLGGDGTINEVVDGIAQLENVTLGYIPIGSGNDFARGLGLPTDTKQALDNIMNPSHYCYINIGILAYDDTRRRFAVSSGIGFDAGVCHEAAVSRIKHALNRLRLGKLTYVGIALRQLLTLTPSKMTILLDDVRKLTFEKTYFTAAMNLMYEGGGFKFCPNAGYGDDCLDVIVAANLPKLKIITLLPTAFKGWHTRFCGIHIFRCKKLDIISSVSLPVHTDGEPVLRQTKISIFLEPEKLRVIGGPY